MGRARQNCCRFGHTFTHACILLDIVSMKIFVWALGRNGELLDSHPFFSVLRSRGLSQTAGTDGESGQARRYRRGVFPGSSGRRTTGGSRGGHVSATAKDDHQCGEHHSCAEAVAEEASERSHLAPSVTR